MAVELSTKFFAAFLDFPIFSCFNYHKILGQNIEVYVTTKLKMLLSLRDIVHLKYGYFAVFLDFPIFFPASKLPQNFRTKYRSLCNKEIGKHDLVVHT